MRQGMRKRMNVNVAALGGNLLRSACSPCAIVIILPIFGVDWTALVTLVGAVGLAVSLAFQDLLRNFIAGIYILIERPFNLGDKITVQTSPEITGTVQSIELRITTVRTEDGVLVVIPNNTLFSTPVTNHSAVNLQRDVIRLSLSNADLGGVRPRINDVLSGLPRCGRQPRPQHHRRRSQPHHAQAAGRILDPPAPGSHRDPADYPRAAPGVPQRRDHGRLVRRRRR